MYFSGRTPKSFPVGGEQVFLGHSVLSASPTSQPLSNEEERTAISTISTMKYTTSNNYKPTPIIPQKQLPTTITPVSHSTSQTNLQHSNNSSFFLSQVRPFFVKTLHVNKEQISNFKPSSMSAPILKINPYVNFNLQRPSRYLPYPTKKIFSSGYQEDFGQILSDYSSTNKEMETISNHQSLSSTSAIDSIPDRDWNQEFNDVLESSPNERGGKLRQLSLEFVEVATKIGKIIIEERNLSHFQKSVPPLFTSGVAGGEKFRVKGIFFKYAVNKNNLFESDEQAMKIAGHELKGHTALVSCGMMHGLKLGLMTLIDYRGFRLTATSSLPINDSTLVYGSSDGGKVVVSRLEVMNKVMKDCAKVLNLKGHYAGITDAKQFIYGPCDLEGHLGNDGKLYAIDLARLFPPETPDRSIPGSFLFKLLRPELVKKFNVPLSSDAFTLFGYDNHQEHDAEVIEATNFLKSSVIPEFAASLENKRGIEKRSINWIIDDAHRSGINIRYLGEIRSLIKNENLKVTILSELTARVLKNRLKALLRNCKSTQDLHFYNIVIDFVNTVFITADAQVWTDIKRIVSKYYAHSLSEEELSDSFDIKQRVDKNLIFQRLQELTAFKFSSPLSNKYFSLLDFNGISTKSKYMYAVPRIEADTAAELARSSNDRNEAKRLLQVAIEKYESVLNLKPDDHVVLSNLGLVINQRGLFEEDPSIRSQLFELVHEKFACSIKIKQDDYRTLVMWADALISQSICCKDQSLLKKALELSFKAESISCGSGSLNIARVCSLQGKFDLCHKWLNNSLKCKQLLSNDLENDPSFFPIIAIPFFKSIVANTKKEIVA